MQQPFPLNPDYGQGRTRRVIRIEQSGGLLSAEMIDIYHHMAISISHDNKTVQAVRGEFKRFPNTLCPHAVGSLKAFESMSLNNFHQQSHKTVQVQDQCTHLADLVGYAIGALAYPEKIVVWEALVDDESDLPVAATVKRNGNTIHQWVLSDNQIHQPNRFLGKPILKGFYRWASDSFSGEEFEAALILHRTAYIAAGRRYQTGAWKGQSIERLSDMVDSCFAFSSARSTHGVFTGTNERQADELL